MPAGLQIRDATGKITLDLSSRITSYYAEIAFDIDPKTVGAYVDLPCAGIYPGGSFYAFVDNGSGNVELGTNYLRVYFIRGYAGTVVVLRY